MASDRGEKGIAVFGAVKRGYVRAVQTLLRGGGLTEAELEECLSSAFILTPLGQKYEMVSALLEAGAPAGAEMLGSLSASYVRAEGPDRQTVYQNLLLLLYRVCAPEGVSFEAYYAPEKMSAPAHSLSSVYRAAAEMAARPVTIEPLAGDIKATLEACATLRSMPSDVLGVVAQFAEPRTLDADAQRIRSARSSRGAGQSSDPPHR